MSICSGRGTESFFNNLPPAPQRAGGVISISWHTNHPFLSRISEISARPRSTASLLFSLCVASIPKPFPPIFIRARSWAVGAAISSGSFRWLWQTSPERSSPGSPCSGKDRHTPKYAGTASMTRRQSTNGLKTTTITLKHYATKIQTEGQLYLQRLFYPACGFRKEAARLVSEQCGTVLSAIQTTLGEESEVDGIRQTSRLAIREVIALPETLDGEKLPRVGVFHPGQRVFWRDPADETSGYYTVCSGNDDVEEPSEDDIILICSSDSEAEVFPCELRPVSDNH